MGVRRAARESRAGRKAHNRHGRALRAQRHRREFGSRAWEQSALSNQHSAPKQYRIPTESQKRGGAEVSGNVEGSALNGMLPFLRESGVLGITQMLVGLNADC